MKRKNLKILLILSLVLVLGLTACGDKNLKTETKEEPVEDRPTTITLVDRMDREVELPFPVTRAVVASRYNNELIRACGAIDKVISVDLNTAQDREYWKQFDPENTIGKGQRELNYEKIVDLDPEVLIIPDNGAYEEAIEKLDPFGIKVFVISGYDTAFFDSQIENIGKMFDVEEGAKAFMDYFHQPIDYIKSSLEGVEKKSLYFETTSDFKTNFPGGYYTHMIEYSGGESIFDHIEGDRNNAEINPEDVVAENPEFIFKNISPDTALQGTGVYEAPSKELMDSKILEIKNRPGWDEIDAVKNDQVYMMSQFGHGGASKLIGAVYMAKWMYPDYLPELDPDEIFRQWLEDFQGFKNLDGHFYPALGQ